MNPRHLAIAGIGLLASVPAWSQLSAKSAIADEGDLFNNLQVVLGASKYEQSAAEAPSSVSIVTSQDIRRFGYRTLGDILNNVRGFQLSGDRNYSYVGVRGFTRTGDYNSRILLLVDGLRTNDNIYQSASFGQEAIVDVSVIDRVEVIRGPSSSLYGSSAFYAVVNVITKRGRDLNGTEASVAGGSWNSSEVKAATGGYLANGAEYLLSASAFGTRGEPRLHYPVFDNPTTNFGNAVAMDGERSKHLFGKLRWGDFTLEGAFVQRVKVVPTASFGTTFNDPRFRTNDEASYLEGRYDRVVSATTELHARASVNGYYYWGNYPYSGPPAIVNYDSAQGQWWAGEISAITQLSPRHRLTTGLEYQNSRRIRQYNADVVVRLDDSRNGQLSGIYVQDEWRIADAALLNIGLRRDSYSAFGTSANPRLALILKPLINTSVKLLAGTAFRVPNAYELYYNDGNVTQAANPQLRPEKISSYEIELTHNLSNNIQFTVGTYRNHVANAIEQIADPATGLLVFQNVGTIKTRGSEFEVRWRTAREIELRAAYARQFAFESLTQMRLMGSPNWSAKFQLSAPILGNRGTIGIAARLISKREAPNGDIIAPAATGDLTLRYTLPRLNQTRLFASIYNLTNKKYFDPGGLEHVQASIQQPGRTAWFGMEQSF